MDVNLTGAAREKERERTLRARTAQTSCRFAGWRNTSTHTLNGDRGREFTSTCRLARVHVASGPTDARNFSFFTSSRPRSATIYDHCALYTSLAFHEEATRSRRNRKSKATCDAISSSGERFEEIQATTLEDGKKFRYIRLIVGYRVSELRFC